MEETAQGLFSKDKYCSVEQNYKLSRCVVIPLKSNSTKHTYENVVPKSLSASKDNTDELKDKKTPMSDYLPNRITKMRDRS
jgi:hypothetical protein